MAEAKNTPMTPEQMQAEIKKLNPRFSFALERWLPGIGSFKHVWIQPYSIRNTAAHSELLLAILRPDQL
jgi:hypothetical protein